MTCIYILNGPNLNMLGRREPEIYGTQTLKDIENLCAAKADEMGVDIFFAQSNYEGQLVEWIHEALDKAGALLINAAAFTHTSIAIHDALKLLSIPIAEVHISNPKTRENFRHHSYIEPLARLHISGQGAQGYVQALEKLSKLL